LENLSKKNQERLGAGVGLRNCHYEWVLKHRPQVAWFEIISENFMAPGGKALWYLDQIREDYPLSLHGVSMSLGSKDSTPKPYLEKLRALIKRVKPLWVSDHLCWTGIHGKNGHDLWPLPYTGETLRHLVKKIKRVQESLGRQILIENLSTYIEFRHSEMPEWEFLRTVAEEANCGILLDINNIFVSAHNHGFDAKDYLDYIPPERVFEIHLAGPSVRDQMLVDSHDHPVRQEVWDLYEHWLKKSGSCPTLLEWDDKIPSFPRLYEEAMKAQDRMDRLELIHEMESEKNSGAVLAANSSA